MCSVRKQVLKNFAKFTEGHLWQNLLFKKEALAQAFSCEIFEISKNVFFTEHLLATRTWDNNNIQLLLIELIFKTTKGSITCSELIINELARSPTWSENVYFANNEQIFTAVLCFTHAEHHLIKLKLYNNWPAQAVNSVLSKIQRNQSNLFTFKN